MGKIEDFDDGVTASLNAYQASQDKPTDHLAAVPSDLSATTEELIQAYGDPGLALIIDLIREARKELARELDK